MSPDHNEKTLQNVQMLAVWESSTHTLMQDNKCPREQCLKSFFFYLTGCKKNGTSSGNHIWNG